MIKVLRLTIPGLLLLLLISAWKTSTKKLVPPRFQLVINDKEQRVDVLVDGKPFTSYIYPNSLKKPVLFPIRTAKGTAITRGWPLEPKEGERVDHPHHVGLWFNFGDVNGHDFWNNSNDILPSHKGPFGTILHKKINKTTNGNDKGMLEVALDWKNKDSVTIIEENTTFVFGGDKNSRIIDRITTLRAVGQDVIFRDNKEGMFALRVARQLEQPSTKAEVMTDKDGNPTPIPVLDNEGLTGLYSSSEGKTGDSVWGTRAKWVALKGQIQNEKITLAIFDNPENIGYPGSWHARGYGLFGINPFSQKAMGNSEKPFDYTLKAGESITFKHRLMINSSTHLTPKELEKLHSGF